MNDLNKNKEEISNLVQDMYNLEPLYIDLKSEISEEYLADWHAVFVLVKGKIVQMVMLGDAWRA